MKPYRRPGRWVPVVIYLAMCALLFAQATLAVNESWHKMMEFVVLGVTLSMYAWWNRHNAAALDTDRVLRDVKREAAGRRDVPLTEVQARYLLEQARQTQETYYGSHGNN